jgi:hypothetical protein
MACVERSRRVASHRARRRPGFRREPVRATWFSELLGGPLVQALQPRHDDRVIEQPAKTLLVGDVPLNVLGERVVVGDYAVEREKHAHQPEPRIAEHAAEWSEQTQRQARRPDECVSVEDAHQRDVHEEPLRDRLRVGKPFVLQIAGHDAGVVGPVPTSACRSGDELEPHPHCLRGRISTEALANAITSHPSRSRRSFIARHQTPPDGDSPSGLRRPR